MHGHVSARSERVHNDVFCGESKSGHTHLRALRLNDGDDIRGAEKTETLSGRVAADCGGRVASMFLKAEEDVVACSNWEG